MSPSGAELAADGSPSEAPRWPVAVAGSAGASPPGGGHGTCPPGPPFISDEVFAAMRAVSRPCVDCGQVTGCWCDFCWAAERVPSEVWRPRQQTPLCTACDRRHERCHFCRGVHMARPFAWG